MDEKEPSSSLYPTPPTESDTPISSQELPNSKEPSAGEKEAAVTCNSPQGFHWLSIVSIALISVLLLLFGIWVRTTYTEIPNVTGMNFADAERTLSAVSDRWQIVPSYKGSSDDEDPMETLALTRIYFARNGSIESMSVSDMQPSAGTLVNLKDSGLQVSLSTQLPEDKVEKLKDAREKALGNNSDFLNAGSWKDMGTYIYSEPQLYSSISSIFSGFAITPKSFAKTSRTRLREIAKESGSNLIVVARTSDGSVLGIDVGYNPYATKAEKKVIRARVKDIKQRADSHAAKYAKKYCKSTVKMFKGMGDRGGSYRIEDNRVVLYSESNYSDTMWTGNTKTVDSTRSYYKRLARWSAQILRKNVTIKMVNKGYHGTWDKFKAKKPKWPRF